MFQERQHGARLLAARFCSTDNGQIRRTVPSHAATPPTMDSLPPIFDG
jgi:hypothetical protein